MVKINSNTQADWDNLASEFQHKSDRSTAILGAVYLEVHLGQLISCFMVNDPGETAQLLDEENSLGSFNARAKAAFCFGLISKNEYHDLKLISKIRNKFTNEIEMTSFAENGVRELCYQLKIPRNVLLPSESRVPRHLFVFASTILAQHLTLRTEQAHQQRRTTPEELILVDVN